MNGHEIETLVWHYVAVGEKFPHNAAEKNAFLAVCQMKHKVISVDFANTNCPFGGQIGPGHSILHQFFKWSKVFRMHAIFHDAYGYLQTSFHVGPGYIYVPGTNRDSNHFVSCKLNYCWLGHLSGIGYWLWYKSFKRKQFDTLPF